MIVQENPKEYWRGYNTAWGFMKDLRVLAKISHEPTLIEMYGKRIERKGHIAKLSTVDESYLWGVLRAIHAVNKLDTSSNEHFGLMFDGDSDWIQVFFVW